MEEISLEARVQAFEFQPEVYLYPTPRMYAPLPGFSLTNCDFGNEINVYVHIPFCKQLCSFCGYLKMITNTGALQDQYIDAVVNEIKMYGSILEDKIIRTLHFGGGTPSLLSVHQLNRLMTALCSVNSSIISTAREVSIEATPESVNEAKFSEYLKLGINRVSIGLQTLNDTEIALSRRHNVADVSCRAIDVLRTVGVPNIVADLMIGIEGQTVESFETSARGLIMIRPDTVELYALGLMPQSRIAKARSRCMQGADIYRCYSSGRQLFLGAGYVQDCHNRYVIPGRGSFLQEDYVWRGMSLIGLGAGARSYARNVHYRNTHNSAASKSAILSYIEHIRSGTLAVQTGVQIDEDTKMRAYLIGNLESLDERAFLAEFGRTFEQVFPNLRSDLLNLNLAHPREGRIILTEKGLDFRDLICTELFSSEVRNAEAAYRPRTSE